MVSRLVPNDLKYVSNVQFHQVVWDATRAAAGLAFDNRNRLLTQNISTASHKVAFGTEGFSSGVHFWNVEIIEDSINSYISIGVSKDCSLTVPSYPGQSGDKGVSYFGSNGHRYFAGTNAAFGPAFKKGDIVGTLLSMEHKTVTFYLNGSRVGAAIGMDQLTDNLYYPCVSLHSLGHTVMSPEVPVSEVSSTRHQLIFQN